MESVATKNTLNPIEKSTSPSEENKRVKNNPSDFLSNKELTCVYSSMPYITVRIGVSHRKSNLGCNIK